MQHMQGCEWAIIIISQVALSYFQMQKEVKEQQASGSEMPRSLACSHTLEDFHYIAPSFSLPPADTLDSRHSAIKLEGECFAGDGAAGKVGSLYHNFQKHLVTTLKLHINLSSHRRSEEAGELLMVQLWEYFIKSSRPTKRFLYSLLMNIPQNIIQFKNKYRDQDCQEHFHRIITQASPLHIQHAQQQLRYQLLRQSQQLVQDGHLDTRRMHKIGEFKEYFNRFILELEKGELNLRLPKQNKPMRRGKQQQRQENDSEPEE